MVQKFEVFSIEEIPYLILEVLHITFSRSQASCIVLWSGTRESLEWRIRDLDPHLHFTVSPLS